MNVTEGKMVFRCCLVLVLCCGLAKGDDTRVTVPAFPVESGHARTCCFDETGRMLVCVTQRGETVIWKDNANDPVVTKLENKPGGGVFDGGPMGVVLVGGEHLVLFYWDGRVQLWSVKTGLKVKDLECDRADFGYAYLSPDGQLVGALSYGHEGVANSILFWNTRDWTPAGRIETDEKINDFSFAAEGKQILACVGHPTDQKHLGFTGIISWDLETKEELSAIEYGSGFPLRIAMSPDGRHVAVGGGEAIPISSNSRQLSGHLRVFDWTKKDTVSEVELYTLDSDYVRSVRFSPDSKFLYSSANSHVKAFRTNDWKREWESTRSDGNPGEISVSPNGKDLLVPDNKCLQMIDAEDGTVRGAKLTFSIGQ